MYQLSISTQLPSAHERELGKSTMIYLFTQDISAPNF